MSTREELKDRFLQSSTSETRSVIMARVEIVDNWCRDHGRNLNDLTIDEVLEIRKLPEWKAAAGNKPVRAVITLRDGAVCIEPQDA